jgi:hypothetical protein
MCVSGCCLRSQRWCGCGAIDRELGLRSLEDPDGADVPEPGTAVRKGGGRADEEGIAAEVAIRIRADNPALRHPDAGNATIPVRVASPIMIDVEMIFGDSSAWEDRRRGCNQWTRLRSRRALEHSEGPNLGPCPGSGFPVRGDHLSAPTEPRLGIDRDPCAGRDVKIRGVTRRALGLRAPGDPHDDLVIVTLRWIEVRDLPVPTRWSRGSSDGEKNGQDQGHRRHLRNISEIAGLRRHAW